MDILLTIKRLALKHDLIFTSKAEDEMERDDLDREMVVEAIVNAPAITKTFTIREPSDRPQRISLRNSGGEF